MYTPAPTPHSVDSNPNLTPAVPKVVYWIGMTSLLTDISSEMVAAILPVYLFSVLHLSALQVGFLDGCYQGGAALARVAFAYWADKYQAAKRIAVIGYALSVLAKLLLALSAAGGLLFVLISLLLDRLGKGVRTAPRDALITLHTPIPSLNRAFGVHRSMDAAGALIGPFLATALLWYWVNDYTLLFSVSVVFGLMGVLCMVLKVASPAHSSGNRVANDVGYSAPKFLTFKASLHTLFSNQTFMRTCLIAALLSAFTISDGLFYLTVQQHLNLPSYAVTTFFSGSALVFIVTAVWFGRYAERRNPFKLYIWAYVGLLTMYLGWIAWSSVDIAPSAPPFAWRNIMVGLMIVLLTGVFYGASEGILIASIVKQLSPSVLITGLALFTTLQGVVKIVSSTAYGWLWQTFNPSTAIQIYVGGLAISIALAGWFWREHAAPPLN